jgi:hypothetical protein
VKKRLASEEKSMETINARVVALEEKYFIKIEAGAEDINIPISEDKPNDVKSAFNKLIARIKEGEFEIELTDIGQDLFSQVAKEYVTQLNREIQEVRGEMKDFGLVRD